MSTRNIIIGCTEQEEQALRRMSAWLRSLGFEFGGLDTDWNASDVSQNTCSIVFRFRHLGFKCIYEEASGRRRLLMKYGEEIEHDVFDRRSALVALQRIRARRQTWLRAKPGFSTAVYRRSSCQRV
ncbi:MAG TPA: hypothetical protein VMR75_00885 [Candidatus Saccharimonadales bacterium]|nr:hypothetical protein [Candidatus Saccharimonadales bacterium]